MDNMFEIGSKKFKISKLNAMKQYHVVRRIAPILGELLPGLSVAAKNKSQTEEAQLEQIAAFVTPIMNGLSKLSDKDAEFVLFGLLSCVEVQQSEGNWARLVSGDVLMFDTIELPILMQAAGRAFMYNMTGFFGALQRS
jgi:hypothetical protein